MCRRCVGDERGPSLLSELTAIKATDEIVLDFLRGDKNVSTKGGSWTNPVGHARKTQHKLKSSRENRKKIESKEEGEGREEIRKKLDKRETGRAEGRLEVHAEKRSHEGTQKRGEGRAQRRGKGNAEGRVERIAESKERGVPSGAKVWLLCRGKRPQTRRQTRQQKRQAVSLVVSSVQS